ncbi:MAG: potassium transporter TrkH [Candidatus Eisenbacteria bacterium]|uniref:Potassium transporter TrkH n=1 Tax=Eiseniibacteriota bacterium TaxID=2212470 RepID=A0A956RP72_UNCEI|nr:potassium transporter TrkH [Candidatus Eisenbacteria bacterium]
MKRPYPGVAGALVTTSPFIIADAWWVYGGKLVETWWLLGAAALTGLVLLLAGITLRRRPYSGRILTTIGVVCVLALHGPQLLRAPGWTLVMLLLSTATLAMLWSGGGSRYRFFLARQPERASRTRGAALAGVLIWLLTDFREGAFGQPLAWISLAAALLVPFGFTLYWLLRSWRDHRYRVVLLGSIQVACTVAIFLDWGDWWQQITWLVLLSAAAALVLPVHSRAGLERVDWWEPILGHPERLLVATFVGLCLAGTFLLALPAASTAQRGVGFVDAAFTAVSAVCVTGLIVKDTPVDFSFAGQLFLLILIQLGGLGIMTFSTAALRLLGRRMSLRQEGAVATLVSPKDRSQVFASARRIVSFTLLSEAVGTVLLAPLFLGYGDSVPRAIWRALFTSVSAFCNAGFALQSASLIPYQTSGAILQIVAALIILGGLSPALVLTTTRRFRKGAPPPAAQAQIALASTALLLLLGFFFILAAETPNTLRDLSFWDRIHNAWFQSVTLRTAGFNSVPMEALRPATITLAMIWMFIGGSPGGTAGGVKTTTAAVLALAAFTAIRGQTLASAFGRTIPHRSVYKAAAITTVGVVSVFGALTAIQLTQAIESLPATFEVISALGTVGLSIGATGHLDGVGKAIIMICMFAGRVGPLTLFIFLSQRATSLPWKRPEEEIDVG